MSKYLDEFPIPEDSLPQKLKEHLSPISLNTPSEMVEVAARYEQDTYGEKREYYHMTMVTLPEDAQFSVQDFRDNSSNGVAVFSVPWCESKGDIAELPYQPGRNHIVASWGDGSFYSYNLAQDVWMTLGLTPRSVGGENQRIIYDDLSVPTVGVAEGEISSVYYYESSRNIHWQMRNDYLRKYLWQRGQIGVRVFFYEGYIHKKEAYEQLLNGTVHFNRAPIDGWYEMYIRKTDKGILLQVHGAVMAITPEKCKTENIYEITWPGHESPMTKKRAESSHGFIYLKDSFLSKYEKNTVYKSTPYRHYDLFGCSPSYLGQWGFTHCNRVGRNLIRVPVRELYKPKPADEILHAHSHAITEEEANLFDPNQEHIVSKTHRFVDQLLLLGNNLSYLAGSSKAKQHSSEKYIGLSHSEMKQSHWDKYPILTKLAQVAPIDMQEQDFLARCKTLSEILGRIKTGPLKQILVAAGCDKESLEGWRGLKLLQALTNILDELTDNAEDAGSFNGYAQNIDYAKRNKALAPLFILNDLRNADAHESVHKCILAIEALGFDHAQLRDGYGLVLDYILDKTINSIAYINKKTQLL